MGEFHVFETGIPLLDDDNDGDEGDHGGPASSSGRVLVPRMSDTSQAGTVETFVFVVDD